MNTKELEDALDRILDTYDIHTDNFGQIIIYTDLIENQDGTLRHVTPEDFDE